MQELRDDLREVLQGNLVRVRERMARAARRASRDPAGVRLVAVTKSVPAAVVGALLDFEVEAIGENRPEDIVRKQQALGREVPWHMIGHFQRKKIPKTLPLLQMVHSVHGMELLGTLDVKAKNRTFPGRLPILIQVNVSGERSKQGFSPAETPHVADIAEAMTNLRPVGLMTMAPYDTAPDDLRRIFARLRDLRDAIGAERLPELSMGMSSDFEEAIEEGATMIRVGSALFDGVTIAR